MVKVAVCVGINNYPGTGADLSGCVNDAYDMAATLEEVGYDTIVLTDGNATKELITRTLRAELSRLKFTDKFVFHFSGHGTWVPDKDGDEVDRRDEGLCCHDFASGGVLLDDELYAILNERRFGVRVTTFSDSCHSGTVARLMHLTTHRSSSPPSRSAYGAPVAKFLPPRGMEIERAQMLEQRTSPARPRPAGILISGCQDHEYSYDAAFNGRPNGAMTYHLLWAMRQGKTVSQVYRALQRVLPVPELPQTPQLSATPYQKYSSLL